MTKRWHTAKDYCSDPVGYEAHRRTQQSEAHAKELADLRRQVDELWRALEDIARIALDALGIDRIRTERLEAQRIIHDRLIQARAALARCGREEVAE